MYFYILFFLLYSIEVIYRQKVFNIYKAYTIFKNVIDPENKKNCCQLSYDMLKTFYMFFSFKQKLEKFNHKHVKIPYEFRENKYYFLLKKPTVITSLESIKDENGLDIYNDIYPYLGPNLDCHGVNIYPKDFGLKKICIKNDDKEYIFEENEPIQLK